MALLLLRHALTIGNGDGDDDDVSTFFSVCVIECEYSFLAYTVLDLHFVFPLLRAFFTCVALLASGCWFPSSLLHHGLGNQYITAPTAKTG